MATKTPADRAVADVEKAIKAHDAAIEKADVAQKKADELVAKANRADRELQWMARHPDLPEDFDLDEFRRSLEAPFEDIDVEIPVQEPKDALEDDTDPVPSDEDAGVADGEPVQGKPIEAEPDLDAADGDDDPWAEAV